MRRILTLLTVLLTMTTAASAQFQFGVEGGLNINHLQSATDLFSKSNRFGFFVGPKVMYNSPIGLGVDAALLYSSKTNTLDEDGSKYLNYFEIPVNLRYQFRLGGLASVYLAAGPQWSHFIGDKSWTWRRFTDEVTSTVKENSISVNVGGGFVLFSHCQLGFNYNIPVTKSGTVIFNKEESSWRNGTWQVRLGYFF